MEYGSGWIPKNRNTKQRSSDAIRKDMKEKGVQKEDAQDGRMKTCCTDPKWVKGRIKTDVPFSCRKLSARQISAE